MIKTLAKCLSIELFAVLLMQAQTGPIAINSKACKNSAVQVVVTYPVTVAGIQMSVPVCVELGAGLRVNSAVTPPVLEIDPAALPAPPPSAARWVIKKISLNIVPPAVTPGSQMGIPLDYTPILGSPMIASFASSRVGASGVELVLAAGGANPKQLQVTLPNYQPLTADDVLTVMYQTLEPALP